jgi:hypothetical protein
MIIVRYGGIYIAITIIRYGGSYTFIKIAAIGSQYIPTMMSSYRCPYIYMYSHYKMQVSRPLNINYNRQV